MSRSTFSRSSARSRTAPNYHAASSRGRARFGTATKRSVAGTPTGGTAPGGGTGGADTPASAPGYATPGAMIRTAGQPPVYSAAAGGGTHSVEGGVIALNAGRAQNVGGGAGVTWSAPAGSSGGAGSGGGSAVAENPGF